MENEESIKRSENSSQIVSKLRENPWILSTFILGIVSLILLISVFQPGLTGNVISSSSAGEKIIQFANSQGVQANLVKIEDYSASLYEVTLSIEGQNVPLYVTKDGKYFASSLIPLTSSTSSTTKTQTQELVKSDKPKVELFIWGYCPYGVQAQIPMVQVAKLLQGKADFNVIPYYDGHGAFETQQNKIQICIQDIASEKYWDYVSGFTSDIYSKCGSTGDIDCDKTESIKLMKSLGIDSDKVMNCVSSQGEKLFKENQEYAQQLGVSGSPTFIINGVKMSVSRTEEAIKSVVCSAFNTIPEECSETLSSASATSSGSC